jgi:hemerythrin-like domain-containing protein
MTVVHRITGYDKRRGNLMVEHDVPQDKMRRIKDLANVEKRDDAAVGSYELAPDQAKKIARAINKMINVEGYIWFLEPFGE